HSAGPGRTAGAPVLRRELPRGGLRPVRRRGGGGAAAGAGRAALRSALRGRAGGLRALSGRVPGDRRRLRRAGLLDGIQWLPAGRPGREIYHRSPLHTTDPASYLTEIQFPIEAAA